jgi:virginiamycin A acetyltransferase
VTDDLRYGMQRSGQPREWPEGVEIDPDAIVSDDARIYGSLRGTRIVVGAETQIFDFAVLRSVGGSGDIVIGERCYIGPHCVFYSGNGITLADDSLIGAHTLIAPADHVTSDRARAIRLQGFRPSRGGVTTEGDCIVGIGCILIDGAYLERGAIVGAGSLVRERVPAYTVWAGNPLRYIRDR